MLAARLTGCKYASRVYEVRSCSWRFELGLNWEEVCVELPSMLPNAGLSNKNDFKDETIVKSDELT